MGNFRPLKTKCWIKFLELKGLRCTHVAGSHHKYTKKGIIRPIPVWANESEIPAFHLKQGCKTLGITLDELYNWAEENC